MLPRISAYPIPTVMVNLSVIPEVLGGEIGGKLIAFTEIPCLANVEKI
jgi:hypothetical protein